MDATLERAIRLHAEGRIVEAESAYRAVLAAAPDDPVALHYLGLVRLQQQDWGTAVALIECSLAKSPGSAEAHFHLGLAH